MTEAVMTDTWKQWEGHLLEGKFALERYLGGSDHSAVFLTQQTGEAQRAIKFIAAAPADRDPQLLRWKRAAAVTHPNLIPIFASGKCQLGDTELLYVVMEYAEENLSQILPQRALLPAEAQEMVKPVVNALAHLDDRGFVHGSVRPSNIMAIGEQVKLSSDTLRAPGEVSFRPGAMDAYAAPEATTGDLSAAADIWSLGMTIVETLTQRRPVWNRTRPSVELLLNGLPAPFQEIARDCLEIDPKERSTAGQIAARLEANETPAREEAASVPPVKGKTATPKWPYLLGLAALVVIAMLVIFRPASRESSSTPPGTSQTEERETPSAPPASGATESAQPRKPSPGMGKSTTGAQSAEAQRSAGTVPPPRKTGNSPLPAGVVHQVMPEVSKQARETISGKVRVRVKVEVDTSGSVVSASFESHGPSNYFASAAMEAAREWKFSPAQLDGRPVASQWLLRFAFTRHDTEVVPARTAP